MNGGNRLKQGRCGVPYLHRNDGEFRAVEKIRLDVNTARPQEDAVTTARGGSNCGFDSGDDRQEWVGFDITPPSRICRLCDYAEA